jgi:hypothetical protein
MTGFLKLFFRILRYSLSDSAPALVKNGPKRCIATNTEEAREGGWPAE